MQETFNDATTTRHEEVSTQKEQLPSYKKDGLSTRKSLKSLSAQFSKTLSVPTHSVSTDKTVKSVSLASDIASHTVPADGHKDGTSENLSSICDTLDTPHNSGKNSNNSDRCSNR
jgi:hypothetical protein